MGIKLKNYVGWVISNIEVSNAEYGIICYNTTQNADLPVVIDQVYIHDISEGRMFTYDDALFPFLQKSYGIAIKRYKATVTNNNIQHTVCPLKLNNCVDINVSNNYAYDSTTEGFHFNSVKRGVISNCQIIRTGYPQGVFHGVAAVMFGNVADVTIEDCELDDVYDPQWDGVGIDYEGNVINVTTLRCNIHDCDSSAIMIYNAGNSDNDNSVSRIINCRVKNCGRKDYNTIPAFIRNYDNIENNGSIFGNDVQRATNTQKIYWSNHISPQLTDEVPPFYKPGNNNYYDHNQNLPLVTTNSEDTWTASLDYSTTTNGENKWYYNVWDGVALTPMLWDNTNNRWHAGTGNSYCIVGDNWQHLGSGADSVRTWVAPKAGVISISSLVRKAAAGGDGVTIGIKKNDSFIYNPRYIQGNDVTGINVNLSDVTVDAGDAIHFIVNMNTNTDTDTVCWNPTITWSQKNQWCSVNDFTDAQGANQWYYEYSDTADVYYAMSYSSGDLCFKGPEDINRVGANIQHPGEAYRSIRK